MTSRLQMTNRDLLPKDAEAREAVARAIRDPEKVYPAMFSWDEIHAAERAIAALEKVGLVPVAEALRLAHLELANARAEMLREITEALRAVKSPMSAPNEDAPKLWLAADFLVERFGKNAPSVAPDRCPVCGDAPPNPDDPCPECFAPSVTPEEGDG